jgi:hypothetical protein
VVERLARLRLVLHITIPDADFYAPAHHEAAGKFLGRSNLWAKFSAADSANDLRRTEQLYGLPQAYPVQWFSRMSSERPMKKLAFVILLILTPALTPALAQTKLLPKSTTARADPCAPIGRTADGKLVYSMKCENLPAPVPPPQAEIREAPPPPEAEKQRTGLFGWSYEVKRADQ